MSKVQKLYTVVFRTGGTERFRWHRTMTFTTREQAERVREQLTRAGYYALAPQDWHRSMELGLPDTYAAK